MKAETNIYIQLDPVKSVIFVTFHSEFMWIFDSVCGLCVYLPAECIIDSIIEPAGAKENILLYTGRMDRQIFSLLYCTYLLQVQYYVKINDIYF